MEGVEGAVTEAEKFFEGAFNSHTENTAQPDITEVPSTVVQKPLSHPIQLKFLHMFHCLISIIVLGLQVYKVSGPPVCSINGK